MADDINKKVIVDVEVRDQQVADTQKKLQSLTASLERLMVVQEGETRKGNIYTEAYRNRAKAIQNFQQEIAKLQKTLKDLGVDYEKVDKSNEKVDKSTKKVTSSFSGLSSVLNQIVPGLGRLIQLPLVGFLGFITGAVLTLKVAFDTLSDAIQRNEDRSFSLQRILLPITTVSNNIRREIGEITSRSLEWAETNASKVIPGLRSLLATIGALSPGLSTLTLLISGLFGENFQEQLAAETEALQRRQQLILDQRQAEIDLAELRARQTELNAIVYDKERQTIDERRQAIIELGKNAEEQYQLRERLIRQEIAVLEDLALADEDQASANRDRIASLKASLKDIESSYNIQERTINRFNTELDREEARRRATALRLAQTQAKKEQQILEENEKLRLSIARQGFDTQLKELQTYYDVREKDIRRRLETELNLTENARAMLMEQLDLIRQEETVRTKELFAGWQDELLTIAGLSADAQINEINARYSAALRNLESVQAPQKLRGETDEDFQVRLDQYERYLFDRYELEIRLEREKQREIDNIEYQDLQRRHSLIETEISREYENDIEAFARNQSIQLDILEESLKKQIEAKRAADLVTYREENQLAEIAAQRRLNDLNRELDNNETNFKRQYEVRKEYLELELEAYRGNIEEEARLLRELRDLEREWWDQRIGALQEYTDAAISIASSISETIANISTQELNQAKADNKAWKADLKARYDAGLISKAYYNQQIQKADDELAAKEAEIARERASRDKKIKLFEIAIDTLAGIARAVSQSPLTFGMPWAAFVATTGAARAAAIASQPLPVAERGMYIKGKRHSQGGEIINVEDGEMIINRNSAAMFPELLSAINQVGGGVPFTSIAGDGGFAARRLSESANVSSNGSEVVEALRNAEFKISIDEFEDVRNSYINVRSKGNIRI